MNTRTDLLLILSSLLILGITFSDMTLSAATDLYCVQINTCQDYGNSTCGYRYQDTTACDKGCMNTNLSTVIRVKSCIDREGSNDCVTPTGMTTCGVKIPGFCQKPVGSVCHCDGGAAVSESLVIPSCQ